MRTLPGLLLFEDNPAVYDHVFFIHVELGDPALNLLTDQLRHFVHIAHAAAGGRHEGRNSHIHLKAPFHLFGNRSGDGQLFSESVLQACPIPRPFHAAKGKLVIAFGVPRAGDDRNDGAGDGVVFALFTPDGYGEHALGLPSNIDQNVLRAGRNDRALNGLGALCAAVLPLEI